MVLVHTIKSVFWCGYAISVLSSTHWQDVTKIHATEALQSAFWAIRHRESGFAMEVLLLATYTAQLPKSISKRPSMKFAIKSLLLMCTGLDHRLTSLMSALRWSLWTSTKYAYQWFWEGWCKQIHLLVTSWYQCCHMNSIPQNPAKQPSALWYCWEQIQVCTFPCDVLKLFKSIHQCHVLAPFGASWCLFHMAVLWWRYGALSMNSCKTTMGVMTPVAIDLSYSTLLSHESIFQASYLAALKPCFDIVHAPWISKAFIWWASHFSRIHWYIFDVVHATTTLQIKRESSLQSLTAW